MRDTRGVPLLGAIAGLALPATASYLLQNLYHVNDAWFIGRVSAEGTAAMMPVTMVGVANFGFILALARGTQSLVGRQFGAGSLPGVQRAVAQGLRLALMTLVPLGLLEWIFAPELLALISGQDLAAAAEPSTSLALGTAYLRTLLCFLPFLFAAPILDFVLAALGDTRTPFRLQILAVAVNTALGWALVLPHRVTWDGGGVTLDGLILPLPLPAGLGTGEWAVGGLGVVGAAVSTGCSRLLAAGLALSALVRRKGLHLLLLRRLYDFHWAPAREILRVGLPAGSSTFLFAVVGMFVTHLVGSVEPAALGGYYVGFRAVESLSFMIVLGFGAGAGTVAAHAVGAGDLARARRAGHLGVALCLLPMLATTVLFRWLPEALVAPFTDDAGIAAAAAGYLMHVAFCQVPQSFETVYGDVMASSGSSFLTASISITGNLLRLPLAWGLAAAGWGLHGIWWAIVITAVLKGLAMVTLFLSGRWESALHAGRAALDHA